MPTHNQTQPGIEQGRKRRIFAGLNAGTAVALAALLVVMVNYVAQRNYLRADWSRTRFYSLSDKTLSLLAA